VLKTNDIPENFVRIIAILMVGGMETALICTHQDGTLLLPVAGIIGFIAGAKVSDITNFVKKC